MATIRCRSFNKAKPPVSYGRKVYTMREANELLKHKGDKATFIVQVMYRQNSSWQGKLVWADENKTVYFRSVLELIKLMDSVIGDEQLHLELVKEGLEGEPAHDRQRTS